MTFKTDFRSQNGIFRVHIISIYENNITNQRKHTFIIFYPRFIKRKIIFLNFGTAHSRDMFIMPVVVIKGGWRRTPLHPFFFLGIQF